MKALKFELFGKMAHFKNPESNIKLEVSYENIHKAAAMGILGAILGLRGRGKSKELGYIEYWEELKDTKISIVPGAARWRKHIQDVVNSTGFANRGEDGKGCNQVIRRQILENVSWTIYIQKDSIKEEYWDKLVSMLMSRKSSFPLSLGKTGFVARLGQVSIINIEEVNGDDVQYCDSIVLAKNIETLKKELHKDHRLGDDELFIRRDYLPIALNKLGMYKLDVFTFTNSKISVRSGEYYSDEQSILYFI